jgi:hypothetical protein
VWFLNVTYELHGTNDNLGQILLSSPTSLYEQNNLYNLYHNTARETLALEFKQNSKGIDTQARILLY